MKQWTVGICGMILALATSGCGKAEFSSSDGSLSNKSAAVSLEDAAEHPVLVDDFDDDGACNPAKSHKVLVCHVPPGNPANRHTICIGKPALQAHLRLHIAHSDPNVRDTIGPCPGDDDGPGEPVDDPADPTDDDVVPE